MRRDLQSRTATRWREFVYEDLIQTFGGLVAFLGADAGPALSSSLAPRLAARRQADVVSNYADVVAALKRTRFRWFLDYCVEAPERCAEAAPRERSRPAPGAAPPAAPGARHHRRPGHSKKAKVVRTGEHRPSAG